jgi:hypothetical protein
MCFSSERGSAVAVEKASTARAAEGERVSRRLKVLVERSTGEQLNNFFLQLKRELGNLLMPFIMYIIWFSNFQFCENNTTTEQLLLETSSRILIHFLFRDEDFETSISISFNFFIQKI